MAAIPEPVITEAGIVVERVLKRRLLALKADYPRLLAMQRLSWALNFAGKAFSEASFHASLSFAAGGDDLYIYELAGTPVGWLWLDLSSPGVGHIRHIQVEQAHWGQGLGREIMGDAAALCLERGCHALTLNVTKSNRRAMALYSRLNYVVVEDSGDRQRMCLSLPRTEDEL